MKHVCFVLVTLLVVAGCKKKPAPVCADGYIYWGGSYASDGLGLYFASSKEGQWRPKQLKEAELPAELRITSDSVAVSICLQSTTEQAPCFCAEPSFYYRVVSVKRR